MKRLRIGYQDNFRLAESVYPNLQRLSNVVMSDDLGTWIWLWKGTQDCGRIGTKLTLAFRRVGFSSPFFTSGPLASSYRAFLAFHWRFQQSRRREGVWSLGDPEALCTDNGIAKVHAAFLRQASPQKVTLPLACHTWKGASLAVTPLQIHPASGRGL